MGAFEVRLTQGAPLVADGATGTELERRGVACGLPLWSAHALIDRPDAIEAIHRDYVVAGAEILTANSFRTQARTLARAGMAERSGELTERAVALARRAATIGSRPVWIAGSMPPLEDCYRPDLTPPDRELIAEHGAHAELLARAGADLLLVETHHSVREARHAVAAARATGLPAWSSFVCGPDARLLSGEPLSDALAAISDLDPACVGVNCLSPSAAAACLPALAACGRPFGVYANLGEPDPDGGFSSSDACAPDAFAAHARVWRDAGARIVGGCCGTRPDHIRAVAADRAA